MNLRLLSAIVIALALGATAIAQDAAPTPAYTRNPGNGGGQRGQRGGMGAGGAGLAGRGVEGTVTEVAADHYTVKTYTGDIYTIHYSANTRFMKQPPVVAGAVTGQGQAAGQGQTGGQAGQAAGQSQPGGQGQDGGQAGGQGRGQGQGRGGFQGGGMNRAALQIKSTDIKVGDAVAAVGEVDAAAKSIGAVSVIQVDPQRAKDMIQFQANYGRTWLLGKVTAIDETKVTLMGTVDNAPHTVMADENTVFRKQRDPITLADIAVGDTIRVDGATNAAGFTAATVNVLGAPDQTTTVPRRARPQ